MICALILGRKGSTGFPGKNLYPVLGRPLMEYPLLAATYAKSIDRVFVSTDDEKVMETGRRHGTEIIVRPAELAQDETPKVPVIRHALIQAEKHYEKTYDVVVDLDVTAPLREPNDLENCYRQFCRTDSLTLFSVVAAHRNPYFNMVEVDEAGYARLCKTGSGGVPTRQAAPKVFDMNASIYFYDRDYLLDGAVAGPISPKSTVYEMSPESAYDIDREIDFKFIEFLMREGLVRV